MDSSSIAFWGILGGMSLVCVCTIVIVYFMCFSRHQSYCMSAESEDLLETTVHHEEVRTVTSETRTSVGGDEEPKVMHRTEQIHRVITKQRSWGNGLQAHSSQPVTTTRIRVSPRSDSPRTQSSSSASNDSVFTGTNLDETLTSPRPGQSKFTSIGTSS